MMQTSVLGWAKEAQPLYSFSGLHDNELSSPQSKDVLNFIISGMLDADALPGSTVSSSSGWFYPDSAQHNAEDVVRALDILKARGLVQSSLEHVRFAWSLSSPTPVFTPPDEKMALEDMTNYQLLCVMKRERWEWQLKPKEPIGYTPGAAKIWYTSGATASPWYLKALLDAESHCRPNGPLHCIPHGELDQTYKNILDRTYKETKRRRKLPRLMDKDIDDGQPLPLQDVKKRACGRRNAPAAGTAAGAADGIGSDAEAHGHSGAESDGKPGESESLESEGEYSAFLAEAELELEQEKKAAKPDKSPESSYSPEYSPGDQVFFLESPAQGGPSNLESFDDLVGPLGGPIPSFGPSPGGESGAAAGDLAGGPHPPAAGSGGPGLDDPGLRAWRRS